jgi:hypothetical protein
MLDRSVAELTAAAINDFADHPAISAERRVGEKSRRARRS